MSISKPVARVTLAVLIALAIIVATSAAVQGLLGRTAAAADETAVRSHGVSGLQTNLNHYRSSVYGQDYFGTQAQPEAATGQGHGCESENQMVPTD